MTVIQIIGKKGSQAKKAIIENTGIALYTGKGPKPDAIINYGIAGERLRSFFTKHPSAKSIPMINKYIGHPKHMAIARAKKYGILVPDTAMSIPSTEKVSDWIEKRIHSGQGKGICQATKRQSISGKYYQRMIANRVYELRVHAFVWIPIKDWDIQKRVGPKGQIAWNFHLGGSFQRVSYANDHKIFRDVKETSRKILDVLGMDFGAIDFIVDKERRVYFIEINSTPGFTEFSQRIYFDAMERLKNFKPAEIKKFLTR